MFAGATGGGMGGSFGAGMGASLDPKQLVFSVMKEISKSNKFIHKSDVFDKLQHQINKADFEKALGMLCNNGTIYSTYDNDIYSLTD